MTDEQTWGPIVTPLPIARARTAKRCTAPTATRPYYVVEHDGWFHVVALHDGWWFYRSKDRSKMEGYAQRMCDGHEHRRATYTLTTIEQAVYPLAIEYL